MRSHGWQRSEGKIDGVSNCDCMEMSVLFTIWKSATKMKGAGVVQGHKVGWEGMK